MKASPIHKSSSSEVAIRVENLSKLYRLGSVNHGTLARDLQSWWARLRGQEDPNLRLDQANVISGSGGGDRFFALYDVSFEVRRGEVLGIIGGNGAGKSTLLKILSRVTTPTAGEVKISGRIASLLEVGTGFHPELTGRENIYLNGAILGMTKNEISRKFDEIVAFSEIEKFLDTPVKRYSSGMYVRLAFAVAAHLDPEILIIDEVLAVGDAEFQKKCFGKMEQVGNAGRTILFVSHNLGMVSGLCPTSILLQAGEIEAIGETQGVINKYLSNGSPRGAEILIGEKTLGRTGNGPLRLEKISIRNEDDTPCGEFTYGDGIAFNIDISGRTGSEITFGISIRNAFGQVVWHLNSSDEVKNIVLPSEKSKLKVKIEEVLLNDGTYFVTLFLADSLKMLNDRIENCISFCVASNNLFCEKNLGVIRQKSFWEIVK